ncbi:hypothetical protein GE061_005568 [Apolygus lucorum]|uniref:Uncharacterized protein n=1 Tax=Apolygus lucorum TaxID=248454 RepID=A0A6A4IQX0_APOLU|nr:hypothetical protein GE061_005568 [Apolygus lucorum]
MSNKAKSENVDANNTNAEDKTPESVSGSNKPKRAKPNSTTDGKYARKVPKILAELPEPQTTCTWLWFFSGNERKKTPTRGASTDSEVSLF